MTITILSRQLCLYLNLAESRITSAAALCQIDAEAEGSCPTGIGTHYILDSLLRCPKILHVSW